MATASGNCTVVYPHNYIQTNTIFEVVKAHLAGARTACADKHAWGYDWLNGPSGKGVDDLARTEINSVDSLRSTVVECSVMPFTQEYFVACDAIGYLRRSTLAVCRHAKPASAATLNPAPA